MSVRISFKDFNDSMDEVHGRMAGPVPPTSAQLSQIRATLEGVFGGPLPAPTKLTPEQEKWRQESWLKCSNGMLNGTIEGPTAEQRARFRHDR